MRGAFWEAETLFREALIKYEKLGLEDGVAKEYCHLGIVAYTRGEILEAEELLHKALNIYSLKSGKRGADLLHWSLENIKINRDETTKRLLLLNSPKIT